MSNSVTKPQALSALRAGFRIERGNHTGYWLTDGRTVSRRRISSKLVKELEGEGSIERADDDTSRVGDTWKLS